MPYRVYVKGTPFKKTCKTKQEAKKAAAAARKKIRPSFPGDVYYRKIKGAKER